MGVRRTTPGRGWLLWGTVASLLAVAVIWLLRPAHNEDDGGRPILPDSVDEATQMIEYEGARVTVPSTWVHMNACEDHDEQWGAAGQDPCLAKSYVVFYPAATFDPRHEPGVHRADDGRSEKAAWAGYVLTDDWAVYVRDRRRAVVRAALASVSDQD